MTAESQHEQDENLQTVARCGRRPGLVLSRDGEDSPLAVWSKDILDSIAEVATFMDAPPQAKQEILETFDLKDRLDDLSNEAARVEAEISRKRGDLSAAESLFKS